MAESPEIRTPSIFDCLSPRSGAVLVSAVAEILADGLIPLQLATLGSFLTAVGDTLSYMGSQRELNELACPKKQTVTVQPQDGEGSAQSGTTTQSEDRQRDELPVVT